MRSKVTHLSAQRLEAFMNRSVAQKLRRQLGRMVNVTKGAAGTTKGKIAGEEGEQVGAGEDADAGGDGAPQAPAAKKRARRGVRGAEDKAEAQEAMEAEAEADAEAGDDRIDDDASEKSGMYSSSDEAKEGEAPAGEADEAGEAGEAAEAPEEDEAGVFGDAPAAAAAAAKLPGPQPVLPTRQGGKAKAPAGSSAPSKEPEATSRPPLQRSKALNDALSSGQRVWSSKLVGNEMTIVVHHKHSECPHSLFVGEVLHKICRHAKMQDPSCKGVKRVHVKRERGEKPPYEEQVYLECEGINIFALQILGDAVDHRRIYTNNIQRVLRCYGVEAARAAVVKEVRQVFGHYGIEVDHRHLSLIADYMGHAGGLRAFNRMGMAHSASPIQQMSFETTMQFMTTACQDGLSDPVNSPSSALVLGQLPALGTGMVNLLVDLDPPAPEWKKRREFTF